MISDVYDWFMSLSKGDFVVIFSWLICWIYSWDKLNSI